MAYETKIAVVYKHRPNMIVVGGNNYKQCNFENISACRRNYKENSNGYTEKTIRWELNLQLCVVACHW